MSSILVNSLAKVSVSQYLAFMREEGQERRRGSAPELCRELYGAVQKASDRVDSQRNRLDRVENLMEGNIV